MDYDMRSALHLAASAGRENCARFLLEHGARVNARDRWGGTPLQDALRENHDNLVGVLTSAGGTCRDCKASCPYFFT